MLKVTNSLLDLTIDIGFQLPVAAKKMELYVLIQTMSLHKTVQPELNSSFQSALLHKTRSV